MTRAQLIASRALWRAREVAARRLWDSRRKRLEPDDPRRGAAFQAYKTALHIRRHRDDQISDLPVITCDAAGIDAIIGREGLLPYVYADSQGHATFGVGHLIHRGAPTAADGRKWGTPAHRTYTAKEARLFFVKHDLPTYEKAVAKALKRSKVKVTQARFNACVSLAFNIGVGGFATSTVVKRMNAGDAAGAADAFLLWNKPPEIRGRRRDEQQQFRAG
jgi:GH24 family phage-related lysozyme (muramidase)